MRWFWLRRKDQATTTGQAGSGQEPYQEPRDVVMAFALAYLAASGARVRVLGDDIVSATLSGGETTRYTTTLARADAETMLLVRGGRALAEMLDRTRERTRVLALRLTSAADPVDLARRAIAAPAAGCGRCAALREPGGEAGSAVCGSCPLRAGKIVLAGMGRVQGARVARSWDTLAAEVTFRVSARDRTGRTDEWVRVAADLETGRSVAALTLAQIEAAAPTALAFEVSAVPMAVERAQIILRPALDAAATFLRQRASDVYRRRVAEVSATHERLRREQSDGAEAGAVDAALARELAALAEVYAVDVHAALESICVVTTPMVEVLLRCQGGGPLALSVDTGRGIAESPMCRGCGSQTRNASLCAQGHITCRRCQPGCATCEGRAAPPAQSDKMRAKPAAAGPAEVLTVEHLDALSDAMWRRVVSWLLSRDGYVLNPAGATEGADTWRGNKGERHVVVQALRPPDWWLIGPEEISRAVARIAGEAKAQAVLISTASASGEAKHMAQERDVLLWDREELRARLAQLGGEHARVEAQTIREAKERAGAAIKTRAALLKALAQVTDDLATATNGNRAVGHAAVTAAVADLMAARESVERALLAWETLVADWSAAFAERPGRGGQLLIEADAARMRSLRERGTHLGKVLRQVVERLARASADGEMGYGAWRAAVLEEVTARCDAFRAQLETVDPARWEDFDLARASEAASRAEQTLREARNAAARSAKAYAQVAQLAGNS